MFRLHKAVAAIAAIGISIVPMWAQSVISAHSGTVHNYEGRVLLDGEALKTKMGEFPQMKDNEQLRTEEGRAEVLLTPGVFLRMAEDSSIRMISTRLSETKVRVENGDVMVEVADLLKDNAVTLLYKDEAFFLQKRGLYRLNTTTSLFRVYSGQAELATAAGKEKITPGHEVTLDGSLQLAKFDRKESDPFYRWNERRDGYLSAASVATASTLYSNGYYNGMGWSYNPLFGLFAYLPYNGLFASPFGYGYYSPFAAYYYAPGYYYGSYGNYGGYSGTTASVGHRGSSTLSGSTPLGHVATSIPTSSVGNGGFGNSVGSAAIGGGTVTSTNSMGSMSAGGGAAHGAAGGGSRR